MMIQDAIGLVSRCIDYTAVLIIVGGIVHAIFRYLRGDRARLAYKEFKNRIGSSMLLGLEFLVAADIVRTVATRASMQSILLLGLLVLIRTFLSWSLLVEIEERWPWQPARAQEE